MPRYLIAISLAILIHLVAGVGLIWGWDTPVKDPQAFKVPEHIQAKLVVIEKPKPIKKPPPKPKPSVDKQKQQQKKKAQQDKKRKEAELKKKRQQEAAKKAAVEKAKKQAAEKAKKEQADKARKLAQEKAKKEAQEKARKAAEAEAQKLAEEQKAREQLLADSEQDLFSGLDDELEQEQQAEEDRRRRLAEEEEESSSYYQLIQEQIARNWSRPPSTRNGMLVGVRMHLLPNGELKDVFIIKSSGDSATDQSTERAVRKVRRFKVPQDSYLFEKYFRKFDFAFQPEDLRL